MTIGLQTNPMQKIPNHIAHSMPHIQPMSTETWKQLMQLAKSAQE